MNRFFALGLTTLMLLALSNSANARTHHYRHHHRHVHHMQIADANGNDPRPSLWCAWWLRRHLHIPKSAFPKGRYNQARAFAQIGTPAPRGCTGCIAVFSRGRGGHVGLVESWDGNGNPVILSGNYNGRVAVAPHPASRLIALRWPNQFGEMHARRFSEANSQFSSQ